MESSDKIDQAIEWIIQMNLPNQEKVLLILLLRNGLRVSEIVDPSNIKKIDNWSVSVYCPKNKVYRTCMLAEASQIEQQYQVLESIANWKRNRWYYYRIMRGLLIDVETQRTGNTAVTHAARNIRAQETYDATNSVEAAQASLGHKSPKSTQSYLKPKRRGAKVLKGVEGELSGTVTGIQLTRTGIMRSPRRVNQ